MPFWSSEISGFLDQGCQKTLLGPYWFVYLFVFWLILLCKIIILLYLSQLHCNILKENNNSTVRIFPIRCNHKTVSQWFTSLSAYDPEGNKYSLLSLTEGKVTDQLELCLRKTMCLKINKFLKDYLLKSFL